MQAPNIFLWQTEQECKLLEISILGNKQPAAGKQENEHRYFLGHNSFDRLLNIKKIVNIQYVAFRKYSPFFRDSSNMSLHIP